MGRVLRTVDSDVFGNIITTNLTTTGLLSPQGGSENIIGYTFISGATTLSDTDAAYVILSNSSFTVNLPATSTNGRVIQIVDGADFSTNNITIGRNGATINETAENLVLNVTASFFLIYYDGDWLTRFYR